MLDSTRRDRVAVGHPGRRLRGEVDDGVDLILAEDALQHRLVLQVAPDQVGLPDQVRLDEFTLRDPVS